jgi:hypothetical protein
MGLLDGCVDERGGYVSRPFCERGADSMISLKDISFFNILLLDEILGRPWREARPDGNDVMLVSICS